MKYLISENIVFDTESSILVYEGKNGLRTDKKLTKTASCVLSVLLSHYGEMVERNHLLYEVWESQGNSSSESSLNQYISILRKTFHSMGIEKSILVVAGKGFIFSRDVVVTIVKEKDNSITESNPIVVSEVKELEAGAKTAIAPYDVGGNSPGTDTHEEILSKVNIHTRRFTILAKFKKFINALSFADMILWSLILVMVYACFYEAIRKTDNAEFQMNVKVFDINRCEVRSDSVKYSNIIRSIINDIYPDIAQRCLNEQKKIFIIVQSRVFFNHNGRVFISLCTVSEPEKKLTYCDNNYYYDYSR